MATNKQQYEVLEELGRLNRLAFDSFSAEASKLAPIVAKSVREAQESLTKASRTLAVKMDKDGRLTEAKHESKRANSNPFRV